MTCSARPEFQKDLARACDALCLLREVEDMPLLQRIVLGLAPIDLDDCLKSHPDLLDEPDNQDRTAVWWATATYDLESLQILVRHGADVNSVDCNGQSPFTTLCTQTLFTPAEQDAIAGIVSLFLEEPSFRADSHSNFPCRPIDVTRFVGDTKARTALLRKCIEVGTGVNQYDYRGHRILFSLAHFVDLSTEEIDILVKAGVDFDRLDEFGHCALSVAVASKKTDVLGELLQRGADYRIAHNGFTLLHLAAACPDISIFDLFARHGLEGVDIFARDEDGYTAMDRFEEYHSRYKPDRMIVQAFYNFVIIVGHSNHSMANENPSDRGDEYTTSNNLALLSGNSTRSICEDSSKLDATVFDAHKRWSFGMW